MDLPDLLGRPPLGVCGWLFGNLPLAQVAQTVAGMEYDGLGLRVTSQSPSPMETNQILADAGLTAFSASPNGVDLAHPETAVRQAAIDRFFWLVDYVAELNDQPLILTHNIVGRVKSISNFEIEYALFLDSVRQIAHRASQNGLRLVLECLNRYEAFLLNSGAEAVAFIDKLDEPNVGVLLDAFHMNIEEQDAAGAMGAVGEKLWLFHIADSNRLGIGKGHAKLGMHMWALEQLGNTVPIMVECVPPQKEMSEAEWRESMLAEVRASRDWF